MIIRKLRSLNGTLMRYLVNDGPAQLINGSYNAYSMLYRGQLSLGLPVFKELIVSQKEIKTQAVQKLALVLYHVFMNAIGLQVSRDEIASLQEDDIPRNEIAGWNGNAVAATHHQGFRSCHALQCSQGFLSPAFLDDTKNRVQDDNGHDGRCFDVIPQDGRNDGCHQQQYDDEVVEL